MEDGKGNNKNNKNEMSPSSHVKKHKNQNDEIISNNNNNSNSNNNVIAIGEEGNKGKKTKKNKKKKSQNEHELNKLQKNNQNSNKIINNINNNINNNNNNDIVNEDNAIVGTTITMTNTILNCTDNNQNNATKVFNFDKSTDHNTIVNEENVSLIIIEDEPIKEPTTINDEAYQPNPLSPNQILDIEDNEQENGIEPYYDVKKSSSKNNMLMGKIKDSTSEAHQNNHSNIMNGKHDNILESQEEKKEEKNDEYDDYDEDDEDNGLLVHFLDEANRIAEAKLAQRRQARVEAREIRMRELERQQKEQEQNADRVFDLHATSGGVDALTRTTSRLTAGMGSLSINSVLNVTRASSMSSRRSSEDSLEEEGRSLRDIRHELKDVEERFRKAMIANAQLDNERASQTYQIQLLKDKLEEMQESYAQLQREFKDKSRECNAFKRQLDKVTEELKLVQGQLNERDTLIAEQGLVIVAVENDDSSDARRALVTIENAQLLGTVQGSLDVRLKKFTEEKQQLMAEVLRLQEQLENYKSYGKQRSITNGPLSDDDYDAQREANKTIADCRYKLQKAEQEVASLQSSLARSETQVIRYKSTAEAAEKAEAELKIERRKLQRENREAMERLEELETANNHLLKRMDKLKNVKSALLKDL